MRLWWELLAPNAGRLREAQQDPSVFEHFEWLAQLMASMDDDAGVTVTYDEAYVARAIQSNIERSRGAIQFAEELRTVSMRPMPRSREA